MILPPDFFQEEIRSEYTVSVLMKEVWAVELDLLAEAQRVFNKNGIRWFAIGGTLLGAVRHNGYIPWDDDIDIALLREDYSRLQKVAKDEFKHPYFFQDEYSDPGVLFGHAKLRNSETTGISFSYLDEKHGRCSFNMGVFIDIFPIDNIPDEDMERNNWIENISEVASLAWRLRKYSHRGVPKSDKYLDKYLERLQTLGDPNLLFRIYDDLLSVHSKLNTKYTCIYSLYCRDKRWRFCSEDFKSVIQMPFENLMIPTPIGYDRILTQLYQDWRVLKRLPTMHGEINGSFYDTNNSYLNYFDEQNSMNRTVIKTLRFE